MPRGNPQRLLVQTRLGAAEDRVVDTPGCLDPEEIIIGSIGRRIWTGFPVGDEIGTALAFQITDVMYIVG
jgi:hypothetical protein